MAGAIFLVNDKGELVEMYEQPFETEMIFQRLLADYPNLLAGDQIDVESARRWVLIAREMAVPDQQDGANRWSVDHLFLDQDAIPTLVEVKRASDTRIRREVVGQMLDYAANAVAYWPVAGQLAIYDNFATLCVHVAHTERSWLANSSGNAGIGGHHQGSPLRVVIGLR